jgi:hypothetical protein
VFFLKKSYVNWDVSQEKCAEAPVFKGAQIGWLELVAQLMGVTYFLYSFLFIIN